MINTIINSFYAIYLLLLLLSFACLLLDLVDDVSKSSFPSSCSGTTADGGCGTGLFTRDTPITGL